MNTNKIYYILLITLLLNSCEMFNNNWQFREFMKTHPNPEKYVAYIIIPSIGCEGCISNAETFLLKNYKRKTNKIKFFIASTSSKKALKIKFNVDIFNSANVEIVNEMIIKNERLIYPVVLLLDSNKIKSIEYQTSKNNAFKKLSKYFK